MASPPPRWWNHSTVAVVTGANKGVGLEIARQLAQAGLAVVLTARDRARGSAAAQSLVDDGLQSVVFRALDVQSCDSIAEFAAWIKAEYGGLDILINNAAVNGVRVNQAFFEANNVPYNQVLFDMSVRNKAFIHDYETGKSCIEINYYGAKRVVEALLPLFRPSPAGARIVMVSSALGQLQNLPNESLRRQLKDSETLTEDFLEGVVNSYLEDLKEGRLDGRNWPADFPSYPLSKIFMNVYTRILARNLASTGQKIYVNAVHPGWVKTDLNFQAGSLSPAQAAEGVVWAALRPPGGPSGQFFAHKQPYSY